MTGWTPKRREGKWRKFLTEEEARAVLRAELSAAEARAQLAAATAVLNPIRQRASHRALHAERKEAK